ncbi:bis(5'-nucleosyl)-tetraphosphatase (symmetrical) YqeK [Fructobacillus sp. M1-13]|uniref:bis(5'-nucleosyl)-tetraphosphatase (symmetrical) n=1 Tax=Fructobacillus papyriferae TaxID=2713171 RepID=A0ABS5QSX4_9LACO|nr:bis(5'-nucleosyl)-tetraphosphatase (symmetrical) YqeK [Fructobacillus papyriferae]MBS9335414.1 HD domain-containing protein [Fructobacillus papyriferae]MCD2158916.1 bis(5'-nucleosyl)-tetraphosphatase (symmetrical) YqeK [Fructobacillus papyriferae]
MTENFEEIYQAAKKQVKAHLSTHRYEHCLRVSDYAVKLAKQNNLDEQQAALAGLVHDYAKERSEADFLEKIDEAKLPKSLKAWGNPIWHGVVGAEFVKDELGIEDPEILQAIRLHTTGGLHDEMTTLDKVVFMADYLEEGRHFPGVKEARAITEKSLDRGVFYQLSHTLAFLADKGQVIYPKTFDAYNDWANYLKK